eukprot:CAMPEP_0113724372 /NCGR_PEP_ID=MMETSP0038_2-20120614/39036_1 /TAXON_ID=2898 /ORGANISM="Cryptomonas paramecium" /LENGTH=30 /DNA_ID=CAMNT_0000654253 /DNA_START=432 /DNA_END=521 /DNA_ORIENTATION=- /assembly_acc=CAM_ASM_000170
MARERPTPGMEPRIDGGVACKSASISTEFV